MYLLIKKDAIFILSTALMTGYLCFVDCVVILNHIRHQRILQVINNFIFSIAISALIVALVIASPIRVNQIMQLLFVTILFTNFIFSSIKYFLKKD